MERKKIIFFGNGLLADVAKKIFESPDSPCDIIFHARTKSELETVKTLKHENPDALGVLASFGVMIKSDVLDLFEPEGILNIHPSLLPKYRGASPIESAILNGDSAFSVSVMKLVKAMDAGPIYFQKTFKNLPMNKTTIYETLATAGASWIVEHLFSLPSPLAQNPDKATFTEKFDKSMSFLTPETDSADKTFRKIVAFQGFPKPKFSFYGQEVVILAAHISNQKTEKELGFKCADGNFIIVDRLQPASRKPMDAKSFLNGLHLR